MLFRLNTSCYQYPKEEDRRILQEVGFRFSWDENLGCMCKAPGVVKVDVRSLEDLMKLVRKFNSLLIMEGYLEIYD